MPSSRTSNWLFGMHYELFGALRWSTVTSSTSSNVAKNGSLKNSGYNNRSELALTLRILYESLQDYFEENLNSFITYWQGKHPAFARYFQQQWVSGQWSPASWARFGRAENIPSGDQQLEGYHLRLAATTFLNYRKGVLDHVVNALYDEAIYYLKVVFSPILMQEKELQIAEGRKKVDRRLRLKDYFGAAARSGQITNQVPQLTNSIPRLLTSSTNVPQLTMVPHNQPLLSSSVTGENSTQRLLPPVSSLLQQDQDTHLQTGQHSTDQLVSQSQPHSTQFQPDSTSTQFQLEPDSPTQFQLEPDSSTTQFQLEPDSIAAQFQLQSDSTIIQPQLQPDSTNQPQLQPDSTHQSNATTAQFHTDSPPQQGTPPFQQQGTPLFQQQGTTPFQQQGTTPFQQQGTPPFQQQGTTPFQQQGITPQQQGITPFQQQGITPFQQQGTTPFQQGTTPFQQQGTTPFQQQGTTPFQQQGTTPFQQQGTTQSSTQSNQHRYLPWSIDPKCLCGQKSNKLCSLKACGKCCAISMAPCAVSSHRNMKKSRLPPSTSEVMVDEQMRKREILWIRYKTGGQPAGPVRSIKPTTWQQKGKKFNALCLKENKEKTFLVERIVECSPQIFH
eukprot:Lithocolla_globosa_v1_NODE_278_length_4688_cov_20.187567.p1 type:complete len:614 gc:universal NODE_278_length_4688_cov_20.187567:3458-1617(-)